MGLALAIDYTLLIISRYRDELADGAPRDQALVRTMATAGRTVVFSATTVALSMVAMVLFPMYFLKSFAYAGIATVGFAAAAAIVVTPAAIWLLGDRLDALDVRRLFRRIAGRPSRCPSPSSSCSGTARRIRDAPRRPDRAGRLVLLLVLGAPFLGVKWGFPDDRVLPASASAHQVGDQLRDDFADDSATAVTVVIPDADGLTPAELERYAAELSQVADVASVSAPGGHLRRRRTSRAAVGGDRDRGRQRISHRRQHCAAVLRRLRSPTRRAARGGRPAGQPVQLTGIAQINRDSVEAITSRLPLVLGLIAVDHLRAAVPAHRQRDPAAESPCCSTSCR